MPSQGDQQTPSPIRPGNPNPNIILELRRFFVFPRAMAAAYEFLGTIQFDETENQAVSYIVDTRLEYFRETRWIQNEFAIIESGPR